MGRVGSYRIHRMGGEVYRSCVPVHLPVPVAMDGIREQMEAAILALGRLDAVTYLLPNPTLFLHLYVCREAVLSSQIEGTQSSLNDLLLFENDRRSTVALDDVAEVSNYVRALRHGLDRMRDGFPLSLRLLREIHAILLEGTRGKHQLPGEFRRSQNWIGGSRPGNAIFVPPTTEDMGPALDNLERYLHGDSIPPLIRVGIAHVQFETIHPFLDGNGRLGRLLITLMLCHFGLLREPILYLSLHFKKHRTDYYGLLQTVREEGNWEAWLKFFLEGISSVAGDAMATIQAIDNLFAECERGISSLGRARFTAKAAFDHLKMIPQTTAAVLSQALTISQPTARAALRALESAGIVEVCDNRNRDRSYIFRRYLALLS
jgi:Fic family protein